MLFSREAHTLFWPSVFVYLRASWPSVSRGLLTTWVARALLILLHKSLWQKY